MPKKYFRYIAENEEVEFDIDFAPYAESDAEVLPEDAEELHKRIEETSTIIKNLSDTPLEVKRKYFEKLLDLSQVAFILDSPNSLNLASNYLEVLREEILLSEGPRIKNIYMIKLGLSALGTIVFIGILYLGIMHYTSIHIEKYQIFFIVSIGALIGTWISFGARKFKIIIQDLISFEEDKMSIFIRLPYIMVCAITFLLLIKTGLLNLSIGDSSVKEWLNENAEVQLLFGILTGLLESKLGIRIYNKANDFLGNDNSK